MPSSSSNRTIPSRFRFPSRNSAPAGWMCTYLEVVEYVRTIPGSELDKGRLAVQNRGPQPKRIAGSSDCEMRSQERELQISISASAGLPTKQRNIILKLLPPAVRR